MTQVGLDPFAYTIAHLVNDKDSFPLYMYKCYSTEISQIRIPPIYLLEGTFFTLSPEIISDWSLNCYKIYQAYEYSDNTKRLMALFYPA